ncbi:MAG: hypothetical protein WCR52_16405 [Bacteroidota bacterium]
MKNLLLLSFLLPLFPTQLKASMGNVVVYYAHFSLKNGTEFDGCLEVFGDGEEAAIDYKGYNRYCSNKGIFDLIKFLQQQLNIEYGISAVDKEGNASVTIYKQLEYVTLHAIDSKLDDPIPSWGFVVSSDVVHVHPRDISKIIFKHAENSKRAWESCELMIGSSGMLDTIRQKKFWNSLSVYLNSAESFVVSFEDTEELPGYNLYNYNPNINVAELKRLVLLKFPGKLGNYHDAFIKKNHLEKVSSWPPRLRWEYDEGLQQRMRAIKQWFWRKGIIINYVFTTDN